VFGKFPTVTVVSAGALEAAEEAGALLAGALLAGALELEELAPEEQAARVPPRDMTQRIPARDRVFRFISWSFYRWVMTGKKACVMTRWAWVMPRWRG
jgi:hypothetical protein